MRLFKKLIRLICIALSFLLCFPSVFASAVSPQNTNAVYDFEYFDDYYGFVGNDYAYYYVSQFGGWDDGIDMNPTDYVATTYGVGFCTENWQKEVKLDAYFYEPDLTTYYHASVVIDISPVQNGTILNSGSAVVYGANYVNEEYGLCDYTTIHIVRLFLYDPLTGAKIYYNITDPIIFDTTGFYK